MKNVLLGNKLVGDGNPCYIIAEIGSLFQDFEEAKKLIDAAVEAGADAIKFQTFEADTITTKKNFFQLDETGNISQYELFKKLEVSKELQFKIVKYAKNHGITIFSSPSHIKDIEIIKLLDLPIIKIGSDIACHIPMLKEIASLGKPIILSTGMCDMQEVRDAVNAILSSGNKKLILMHCVSDYPAKVEEANLNAINSMKKEFDLPVGFSDHTIGTLVSLTAATMGANILEKHFRHEENSPKVDDVHSLTKEEFSNLVKSIRVVEKAKGNGVKTPSISEKRNLLNNRVSIISIRDIPRGTIITKEMIDVRRPGMGIQPKYFNEIIGKTAKEDISKEEPITWDMIN